MNNEMLLLFLSCFVSACFGAMAMLTVVLFFTERREKKADSFPCWDDDHETPTWTPGGNE